MFTAGLHQQASRGSDISILPGNASWEDIAMKRIANIKNLVAAYELIKSNPGNMTPGVDTQTLDGMNIEWLKAVQRELKNGTYRFPPARRIQIPKLGKNEMRPLTIASPRDKVVQKAMQLVLEQEYEKIFLDSSHGFRPGRGTRTAMQYVEAKFQSSHYIIEADFSKAFDTIQHKKLMEILSEKIKCEKTLKLIESSLKAGYIEFGELHKNLDIGTPQGSILSPLLCNIYLHKLDGYMEELKKQYNKGEKRQRNKEYEKLQNKVKYWRMKGYDKSKPEEFKELLKELTKIPSKRHDDSFVRIHYVRYADDFIIGVEGSYKIAREILEKVSTFVEKELALKLNPSKTGITKFAKTPVKFLGYIISSVHMRIEKPIETLKVGKKVIIRKKVRLSIRMDYEKVLRRLENNGFIKKTVDHANHKKLKYCGTYKGNMINLDHVDILRYYNSVMRGIYNYYNFTRNILRVGHVLWLLEESCALTLARKYKLKTLRKVYQRFGKDLGVTIKVDEEEEKRVSIFSPKNLSKRNIKEGTNPTTDPLQDLEKVWNAKFTKTNLFKKCIICKSSIGVEMHHVRKIRELRNKKSNLDFFTRQMAAINRKQVPLCREHHIRLHNDTWTKEEKIIFQQIANHKDLND